MRIVLSLSLATIIPIAVTGCVKSAYQKNADAADEMIDILNEYADALESVKDRASAKAAAARIRSANERMKSLSKTVKDLPKVSVSDKEKLDKEYMPKIKAAGARLEQAGRQAALKSGGEPTFLSAVKEMSQVGSSMSRFGK